MEGPMKDRVALVTGGGTGIGRAASLAFAREGAKVVIASRTQETGEETVRHIRASGGEAAWVKTDVTQDTQAAAMVDFAVQAFGRLDYAFNNAGSGGGWHMTDELTEANWDATIDGYLKSTWLCMKYEIKAMRIFGGGVIVNNSSVDGERAFPPAPAYSAAKHGVLGLTKSAGVQYAKLGIRINAVCPGWILTPPVEEALQDDPASLELMLSHQPIGRLGKPEEIAEAVVWLCSEKASLITATVLPVDGGYLAV